MSKGNDGEPQGQEEVSATKPISGLARAWMYGAIAMEFTASVVGGGLLGYFLDRWWSTQPILTVVLLLTGCAGGITLLLRGLTRLETQ